MATYTIYDGTQVTIPNGLSDIEANNLIAKTFPEKAALAGTYYDRDKEYNVQSGVRDLSVRFGNAIARGNMAEIIAEFDNAVGEGNWGISDFNAPYVTAQGMRNLGIEPEDERKVLLDGTRTDWYDVADAAPELIIGGAATVAELIPFPGTNRLGAVGASRGLSALRATAKKALPDVEKRMLALAPPRVTNVRNPAATGMNTVNNAKRMAMLPSLTKLRTVANMEDGVGFASKLTARAFSPSLVARSLRAGGGTLGASLGLEAVQKLRGTQRQTPAEQFYQAGMEGLMVAGGAFALGLPFAAVGMIGNRISGAGINVEGLGMKLPPLQARKQSMVDAEVAVRDAFQGKTNPATGRPFTNSEINQFMIHVTLKELLGKEKGLLNKAFIKQESIGSKQLGDEYIQRTLTLLDKYKRAVFEMDGQNLTVPQYMQQLRQRLTKSELDQVEGAYKGISRLFDDDVGIPNQNIEQIMDLFGGRLAEAYRHGQGKFSAAYDGLNLQFDKAGSILIDDFIPGEVSTATNNLAAFVNQMADDLGSVDAQLMLRDLSRVVGKDGQHVLGKINATVDFETDTILGIRRAVPKTQKKIMEESAEEGAAVDLTAAQRAEIKRIFGDDSGVPEPNYRDATVAKAVTAGDLLQLDKGFRQYLKDSTDKELTRRAAIATNSVQDELNGILTTPVFKEWRDVRSRYKEWVAPFNTNWEWLGGRTTAQSPAQLIRTMEGRKQFRGKPITFETLVRDMDKAYKDIDAQVRTGKYKMENGLPVAPEGPTSDMLLGTLGVQYMRGLRSKHKLTDNDLAEIGFGPQSTPEQRLVGAIELRRRADMALKEIDALVNSGPGPTKSHKAALNRLFGSAGLEKFKGALRELRDGKDTGVTKLQAQKSYLEAQDFVTRVSSLWKRDQNAVRFDGNTLTKEAQIAKDLFDIDPGARDLYQTTVFSELFERFLSAEGLNTTQANTMFRDLGEAIFAASRDYPDAMKMLLGDKFEGMRDLSTLIHGAHNLDPMAGSITVAGLPAQGIRKLINGAYKGAGQTAAMMFAMKALAPGSMAWRKIRAARGYPIHADKGAVKALASSPDGIVKTAADLQLKKIGQEHLGDAIGAGAKSLNSIMAGRNGLWAMSVASYMQEVNESLPNLEISSPEPVPVEFFPPEETTPAQDEGADQDNNVIQNLISALSGMSGSQTGTAPNAPQFQPTYNPVNVRSALNQGKRIAAATR